MRVGQDNLNPCIFSAHIRDLSSFIVSTDLLPKVEYEEGGGKLHKLIR